MSATDDRSGVEGGGGGGVRTTSHRLAAAGISLPTKVPA